MARKSLSELEAKYGVEDQEPVVTIENPKQVTVGEMLLIGDWTGDYWYGYVDVSETGVVRAEEPDEPLVDMEGL